MNQAPLAAMRRAVLKWKKPIVAIHPRRCGFGTPWALGAGAEGRVLRISSTGLRTKRSQLASGESHVRSSTRYAFSQAGASPSSPQGPRTEAAIARYSPPQAGLISTLPASWIPYAELARIDKPTGTYYLYFPCLFSTLLAAPMVQPIASLPTVAFYGGLFFTGALIMRGAGCTINDLWDRNLDPQVARTRLRPIARGAVTPRNAVVFTGFQLLAGLGVLLSFPHQCLYYGVPSLLLVTLYPLAKRVTYYPQVILGLTFSWGAWMGFPALGINLLSFDMTSWSFAIADASAFASAACLYSSCVVWTLIYDMIYAFQDIRDDAKAGIKSIALAHQTNTKRFMYTLACVQAGFLAGAGYAASTGAIYAVLVVCSPLVALCTMIRKVDLKDPKDCWRWFKRGSWLVGGSISIGLFADYLGRLLGVYESFEPAAAVKE